MNSAAVNRKCSACCVRVLSEHKPTREIHSCIRMVSEYKSIKDKCFGFQPSNYLFKGISNMSDSTQKTMFYEIDKAN